MESFRPMVYIPSDEAISLQFMYIFIIPMYTIYNCLVEIHVDSSTSSVLTWASHCTPSVS